MDKTSYVRTENRDNTYQAQGAAALDARTMRKALPLEKRNFVFTSTEAREMATRPEWSKDYIELVAKAFYTNAQ